ncbi:SET and MYND domain-containing protein 4-like isoform X2 [Ischnura elegans]|uniref:SET and MYND domain-containing protein 4-like isoform X2 n=1 Tax=Ischnura elegans TaxID=197161 RepID=UPI001ED884B7|nr:SET and MYND domain-containing protein 4-like isoform X2 [Ischnura elegans]
MAGVGINVKEVLWEEIFGSLRGGKDLRERMEIVFDECEALDDKQTLKYLLNDSMLRETLQEVVTESFKTSKSVEESSKLRERGNEYFNQKKYNASLWLYNKSIELAPEGEILALAIGNRSAALFHLKCYEICVRDIKYAIEMGYPQNLQPKIYKRLGQCFMQMEQYANAIDAFRVAEKGYGDSISSKTKEELHSLVEESLVKLSEPLSLTRSLVPEYKDQDKFPFESNASLPFASSKLHIMQDEKKGRCVFAKQDISAGDILFYEPAYVLFLKEDEKQRRCHFCSDSLLAPVPCASCTHAIYCSCKCRDDAWDQYHSYECGYKILSDLGWPPMLSIRALLRAGNELAKSIMPLLRDDGGPKDEKKIGSVDDSSEFQEMLLYNRFDGLSSTMDKEDRWKRFLFVMAAVLLSYFLTENSKWKATYEPLFGVPRWPEKLLEPLATVALKHLAQSAANNFLVRDLWSDEDLLHYLGWKNQKIDKDNRVVKIDDDWHDVVASAVYVSSSMLNHSCKPNCTHSFFKQCIIAKASEDIPEGKEVCIHYGQVYTRKSRQERRKFLRDNCFFDCECEACIDPVQYNAWKSRAYSCPECAGPFVLSEEMSEDDDAASDLFCLDCKKKANMQKELDYGVDLGHVEYCIGMEDLRCNQLDKAVIHFRKCLEILQKCYYHENLAISQLMDKISFCYASQGCCRPEHSG